MTNDRKNAIIRLENKRHTTQQRNMSRPEERNEGMNIYIQTQILNMTMAAQSFVQTCRLGALKDNGRIDPDEERILKKINAATENYIKELNKIK